jgi:predicted DsbA family dithiol-disulfide isomerase
MLIEVYADVVCPWCFIGKRRLERALTMRPEIDANVKWRPFQLNPWMPPEGMTRAEFLTAKFGAADAGRIYDGIRRTGDGEGLEFAFELIDTMPNTLPAHRLIRWADQQGGPVDQLVDVLFQGYFTAGARIGEMGALADAAAQAGYDRADAFDYLQSGEDADLVREADAGARQVGIQGVPCFIIEERYAVSGAQEPEYFMPLFDLALGAAGQNDSLGAPA